MDVLGCGRGKGNAGNSRESHANRLELSVFLSKFVPPFGDAVRLIDSYEADGLSVEVRAEALHGQSFRCDVEYLDAPGRDRLVYVLVLFIEQAAVDECGRDAVRVEIVHLILHKGDERRNDESQPVEYHRRQLVADGLARARGHEHEAMVIAEHVPDDFFLHRTEGAMSEAGL